ncbi:MULTISPECIES: hypothetical protein [Dehalococcoides]|jgi:cadmium resistance protein CadD (predicted permease)|uniref:Putative anchoring protein KB1rdhB17 n=2 Tax=Dehalococcoides mccartyi TaxID=61435 RepID=A0A0A7NZQ9_9CHLR|nr:MULTISPECIES: hypothetical protein [Dehalococcoides]AGG06955.1 putative reductive dehalogenase anchoring protein [Dehalococcoides mccartyi DCMB5]AIZ97092.1 putative anchoring protein KB1rdhB17 [Dehalococcoides mccartyi]
MPLILGIFIGAGIAILVSWLRSRAIKVKWYEWILGVIALFSAIIGVQHYLGSLSIENESTAGWMGLLVFEGIALILVVFSWQLVARRAKKS